MASAAPLTSLLKGAAPHLPFGRLVVAGHSLGGAVATVAGLEFKRRLGQRGEFDPRNVRVVTFDAPLCVNAAVRAHVRIKEWGAQFVNVVNHFDVVPRLLERQFRDAAPDAAVAILQSAFTSAAARVGGKPLAKVASAVGVSAVARGVARVAEGVVGGVVMRGAASVGRAVAAVALKELSQYEPLGGFCFLWDDKMEEATVGTLGASGFEWDATTVCCLLSHGGPFKSPHADDKYERVVTDHQIDVYALKMQSILFDGDQPDVKDFRRLVQAARGKRLALEFEAGGSLDGAAVPFVLKITEAQLANTFEPPALKPRAPPCFWLRFVITGLNLEFFPCAELWALKGGQRRLLARAADKRGLSHARGAKVKEDGAVVGQLHTLAFSVEGGGVLKALEGVARCPSDPTKLALRLRRDVGPDEEPIGQGEGGVEVEEVEDEEIEPWGGGFEHAVFEFEAGPALFEGRDFVVANPNSIGAGDGFKLTLNGGWRVGGGGGVCADEPGCLVSKGKVIVATRREKEPFVRLAAASQSRSDRAL